MGLTKPHFLDEIWKGLLSLGGEQEEISQRRANEMF